jgi:hypothetical protein
LPAASVTFETQPTDYRYRQRYADFQFSVCQIVVVHNASTPLFGKEFRLDVQNFFHRFLSSIITG